MLSSKSNAARFIAAYNKIDKALRAQYNFKASVGFADVLRQTASKNLLIAKFEDELYDYSRLRNAIVHNSYTNYVIAEPHETVVDQIEHIAELITTPPSVIDTIARKNVITLKGGDSITEAIKIVSKNDISNIPVYENTMLIGVINTRIITECIGRAIKDNLDLNKFASETKISDCLDNRRDHYKIADKSITVADALKMFSDNLKLQIILITASGNNLGKPIGIISTGDIIKMNKILEAY